MPGVSDASHAARGGLLPPLFHELRNVLANVVHSSELLADGQVGQLSGAQQEVATILRENCSKLQLLIEYIAACESWRSQGGRPQIASVALRPLVDRCLRRYQSWSAAHGVELEHRCDDASLATDALALNLVLDNLIAHAIQVSPRGGRVSLQAGLAGGELRLELADQGPELESGQVRTLLETVGEGLFSWKGERPLRSGLAVASDCVSALGGKLELKNGSSGAHFEVRLPSASGRENHGG